MFDTNTPQPLTPLCRLAMEEYIDSLIMNPDGWLNISFGEQIKEAFIAGWNTAMNNSTD